MQNVSTEYALDSGSDPCRLESWTFEDNILDRDPDEGGAGLYLRPDTRYTDTAWDMVLYWKQDILKSPPPRTGLELRASKIVFGKFLCHAA